MHFTRMRIQNFQNVVLFDEELSPGLNVFAGKSRVGKSARSIRPFRWLWTNRPLGDKAKAWIRKGTNFMSVEVWTSDGYYIQHYLSQKDHYYKLQKPDQDKPSTFRAFGQHPPEEILQALNLKDINFQDQHSPHYLLSMNSSEVARELNDVANLSEIDDAFTAINARLRKDRASETSAKAMKEDLEQKQKQYEGLEELKDSAKLLESLELQKQTKLNESKQLLAVTEAYQEKQKALLQYEGVDNLRDHLEALDQAMWDHIVLIDEIKRLNEVAERYKHYLKELAKYEDLPAALRAWNRVNNSWANKKERISVLKEEANNLVNMSNRYVESKNKYEEAYNKHLKELEFYNQNFPAICPLCGKER